MYYMYLTKKNRKFNNKTRNTRKKYNNKLTIDIDFSAKDGGFSVLSSDKVMKFLQDSIKKGRNLIQTVPGKHFYANRKTKLHLQAIKYHDYSLRPEWKEVLCKPHGKWLKSTPCKIGTRDKVFAKYRGTKTDSNGYFLNQGGGFAAYLYQILRGEITEKKKY